MIGFSTILKSTQMPNSLTSHAYRYHVDIAGYDVSAKHESIDTLKLICGLLHGWLQQSFQDLCFENKNFTSVDHEVPNYSVSVNG